MKSDAAKPPITPRGNRSFFSPIPEPLKPWSTLLLPSLQLENSGEAIPQKLNILENLNFGQVGSNWAVCGVRAVQAGVKGKERISALVGS